MNRLFILGNGFDLSHNLKVGYNDYVNSILDLAFEDNFENRLLAVKHSEHFKSDDLRSNRNKSPRENWNKVKKLISERLKESYFPSLGDNYISYIDWKNSFLADLVTDKTDSWADFESYYYKGLIRLLDNSKWVNNEYLFKEVIDFNQTFISLKDHFEEYLCGVYYSYINRLSALDGYTKLFQENKLDSGNKALTIKEKIFLNFNYTSTAESLYEISKGTNSSSINIHGELKNSDNPIILGYGDESDSKYSKIEDLNMNVLMDNFKSVQYSMTKNLGTLSGLLEKDQYYIDILGHSCGVTDRVLLKNVFEHENCVKICIHQYGGKKGYMEVFKNISRHFSDKNLLRKKVKPFSMQNECPQYN